MNCQDCREDQDIIFLQAGPDMVGKNTQTCEMIADNIIKGRKVDDRGVSVKAGQGIRSLREQSFWKSSLLHLFPQETDSDVEIYMQEMYWESMSSENPFQRICGEKEMNCGVASGCSQVRVGEPGWPFRVILNWDNEARPLPFLPSTSH